MANTVIILILFTSFSKITVRKLNLIPTLDHTFGFRIQKPTQLGLIRVIVLLTKISSRIFVILRSTIINLWKRKNSRLLDEKTVWGRYYIVLLFLTCCRLLLIILSASNSAASIFDERFSSLCDGIGFWYGRILNTKRKEMLSCPDYEQKWFQINVEEGYKWF